MTSIKEYNSAEHALAYLARADRIAHRTAGEAVVLELVPRDVRRILDLGAGDGRLLALLRIDRPAARGVATDLSPTMLDAARARFAGDPLVEVVEHDLDAPLGVLGEAGTFDAVVSSFAIHHCAHARKRALYAEVFGLLAPGGVFYNLEHVASPTPELHAAFFDALGMSLADEDRSNQLLAVETQVGWLREIGFVQVDCFWKWRELAVFGGVKP
ncbi:MAG TPA: class I SAM-dependent methyltransferase [Gemmatimonadaceae bacterium]|nr:class I SAM-dependent methyltransferase [Gemmatimonadaceae bacterium]